MQDESTQLKVPRHPHFVQFETNEALSAHMYGLSPQLPIGTPEHVGWKDDGTSDNCVVRFTIT